MGERGLSETAFDYVLNEVPFTFIFGDTDDKIDMLFIGGLVGVSVDEDYALTPKFGYGVVENKKIPKNRYGY